MNERTLKTLNDARRVSTPLVAIETQDQWATLDGVARGIFGRFPGALVRWDPIQGFLPVNELAAEVVDGFGDDRAYSTAPSQALELAVKFPAGSVLAMVNAYRFLQDPQFVAGVLNLREAYKTNRRTLILLGPAFDLPPELRHDVFVLTDPLPTREKLEASLLSIYKAAGLPDPDAATVTKAVNATLGLSGFAAEQVFAMSLKGSGIDLDDAWERKRAQVQRTRGLSISRGGPTLDDLGGLAAVREKAREEFESNEPPALVLRLDELDKALAGAGAAGEGGDSTGVSQDQLGQLLQWMEDRGHGGFIAVGPAGTGKSGLSKALGATFGVPTVELDLGALLGSLVGESQASIRSALAIIDGVAGGGRAFVVATCNDLATIPVALRRRFTDGVWFFDLPTAEEREAIWRLQLTAHKLPPDLERPKDDSWTGAEIRNACRMAARMKEPSLTRAAQWIVPVAEADPRGVAVLRAFAHNRFLSAATVGKYKAPGVKEQRVFEEPLVAARSIELGAVGVAEA